LTALESEGWSQLRELDPNDVFVRVEVIGIRRQVVEREGQVTDKVGVKGSKTALR
jgi:hypothetical protein